MEAIQADGWKRWQIYLALAALILTLGTVIFRAGSTDARNDARLNSLELEIKVIEVEYARKDLIDQRMGTIEQAMKRIEDNLDKQNDLLRQITKSR